MLDAERKFPEFAFGLLSGLYRAFLSDPTVFLLGVAGWLLGSPRRRVRGIGASLGAYITFRRMDEYITLGVQIALHPSRNKRHQPTMEDNGVRTNHA